MSNESAGNRSARKYPFGIRLSILIVLSLKSRRNLGIESVTYAHREGFDGNKQPAIEMLKRCRSRCLVEMRLALAFEEI